ncbi:MAG: hypothetical protein Q8L87_02365 [Anaerolineales bacterium]|nr:hypothetical protein [Anaerolineales bacterium]
MTAMPLNYREETVKKIFDHIKSGESFYLIGAPSAGKTRLLDFLMGDDPDAHRSGDKFDRERVKQQYLKTEAHKTWLVRLDMNRIHQSQEGSWIFHFYQLMLHSILLASNRYSNTENDERINDELMDFNAQVIISKDELMAHRVLEMAVNRLCQKYDLRLCFLFDEFDATYRSMPLDVFAHLRAIRDANKYFVSYGLFLRALPETLRTPLQHEGFFELISSRMIGIGLYSKRDMYAIVEQWEKRHEQALSSNYREWLWEKSGGHPGVAHVLFDLLAKFPEAAGKLKDIEWFARQETVREEFRKIWEGLTKEEQAAMQKVKQNKPEAIPPAIGAQLLAKGLLKFVNSTLVFFSPLVDRWL